MLIGKKSANTFFQKLICPYITYICILIPPHLRRQTITFSFSSLSSFSEILNSVKINIGGWLSLPVYISLLKVVKYHSSIWVLWSQNVQTLAMQTQGIGKCLCSELAVFFFFLRSLLLMGSAWCSIIWSIKGRRGDPICVPVLALKNKVFSVLTIMVYDMHTIHKGSKSHGQFKLGLSTSHTTVFKTLKWFQFQEKPRSSQWPGKPHKCSL